MAAKTNYVYPGASQRARSACRMAGSMNFHWDDCAGCAEFVACARQGGDWPGDIEVFCSCGWWGREEDRSSRIVQRQTWQDPEVWEHCCPECGNVDLEDA